MARFNREDARTVLPQLEKRIDNNTKEILDKIASLTDFFYPIGTVYETLNGDFDPNKIWGGEWERIKGKTLVGVDEDDADFVDGASGGEKNHTLTISEMPSHNHSTAYRADSSGSGSYDLAYPWGTATTTAGQGNCGDSQAHNNMPPYIAVYMWRRTK